MDPEEISRKAQKQRNSQKNSLKVAQTKPKSVYKPQSSESWYVFRRIFPMNYFFESMLVSLLLLTGCFGYIFMTDQLIWQLYGAIASLLAAGVVFAVYLVLRLKNFYVYKNWRKELSFQIVGWDQLGDSTQLLKDRKWTSPTSVEIILKPGTSSHAQKLVEDALYLFTKRTVERYWGKKPSANEKEWIFEGPLKVSGTARGRIVGEICLLISVYLKAIQQQNLCIERVEIVFNKSI